MIGIGTTVTPGFEEWKDTLSKEPDGDVKKRYVVTCHKPSDWTKIHSLLLKDGTLEDNIPTDAIQCSDVKGHSPIRGTYILDAAEVADLLKCSEVYHIEIDQAAYPGTYMPDPLLLSDAVQQQERYSSTVKNIRGNASSYLPSTPLVADKDRAGFQLLRSQQKSNPWGTNVNQVLNNKPLYYGDGRDVDVVVADQAAWLGHIEFQNNLGGPDEYIGGNVLTRKNISTTAGTCDVLDLVLDSPYYIDPDWFNNDPATLTTRWDGTTVPQEQSALAWWSDSNKRSAAFASIGTVDVASIGYTRDRSNGSNVTYQTAGSGNYHGTPCASQAYGRNYGWAFNSNKWYVNAYGTYGTGTEKYFDILKLFHLHKPINLAYNTKDPTTSSNSFGYRKDLPNSAYYFFRSGLNGADTAETHTISVGNSGASAYTLSGTDSNGNVTGNNPTITAKTGDTLTFNVNASGHPFLIKNSAGTGTSNQASNVTNNGAETGTVTFSPTVSATYYYQCQYHSGMVGTITIEDQTTYGVQYNALSQADFLNHFYQGAIRFEWLPNSLTVAGEELIDAGVIFVCSAGNTNQKIVKYDHLDYNNYWATGPDTPYNQATTIAFGYNSYNSISRQGFPGSIGQQTDNVAGITTYRTIAVGALDDSLDTSSRERKANYSNMGNLIPFYASADNTLAACDNNWPGTNYNRYDAFYTLNSNQSVESEDCLFNGTSAACPVACGIIATKLQYNREWKYTDVLNWVTVGVGTQAPSDFYKGSESTSATDSNWSDMYSTEGGEPIILYDAVTGNETESGNPNIVLRFKNAGGLKMSGINFINT